MAHAYADRSHAVETLAELLQVDAAGLPSRAERLLDASAGKDTNGGTVFRPYLTAGLTIANSKNTTRVHEAEGVVFDQPITTIRALVNEQASWDAGLVVPDEWTVDAVIRRLFGRPRGSRIASVASRF